jgi:hypothetical protein
MKNPAVKISDTERNTAAPIQNQSHASLLIPDATFFGVPGLKIVEESSPVAGRPSGCSGRGYCDCGPSLAS